MCLKESKKKKKKNSRKVRRLFFSLFRNSHIYECSFLSHCLYI